MVALPVPTPGAEEPTAVGRRGSARLRLAIPARFVSIYSTQPCVLLDISRTGARLALPGPLARNQSGFIELGRLEVFGTIVRMEKGPDGGVNAMVFDEPIAKSLVLEIRKFAEDFELREHQALRDQVRRWVAGEA
ncbi:MAG TPA: PilZ domain-containing protein [Erythrobacter sp.]